MPAPPATPSTGASVQAVVEGVVAALLRGHRRGGASLLAAERLLLGLLPARLDVGLRLALALRILLVGRAGEPASLLVGLRVVETPRVVGDTATNAGVARTEAGLQAGVEVAVAALDGLAHAGGAVRPGGPDAPRWIRGGRRAAQHQRRGERDGERGEDGAAHGHGQDDLPIDQLTLVSSLGLMVTFSVFLPSSPCQTSTS